LQSGGRGRKGGGTWGSKKEPQLGHQPTLASAGIDKKLSSRAQKLAALPLKQFEETVSAARSSVDKAAKAAIRGPRTNGITASQKISPG
jgi:hypothetical protein